MMMMKREGKRKGMRRGMGRSRRSEGGAAFAFAGFLLLLGFSPSAPSSFSFLCLAFRHVE